MEDQEVKDKSFIFRGNVVVVKPRAINTVAFSLSLLRV
jgi:hypothetical protein